MTLRHADTLTGMGEAKRRKSAPPTPIEKTQRVLVRFWNLHPSWYRSIVHRMGLIWLVFLGIALVCVVIVVIFGRP